MTEGHAQTTVLAALARRVDADPDGPYLDFAGVELTAAEMDRAANRLARVLATHGVARGDRVATLLENSPEQVVSFFAAAKLGAIQVPINTAYKGEFLRHVLVDSGARVLIVQGDLADRVDPAVGSGAPELEAVIVVGAPPERGRGAARARLGSRAARGLRRAGRRCRTAALGPRLLHLHRGDHRSVEGLHAPAPLRGRARPSRSPAPGSAGRTTSSSRRCRCSTSTRSRCAWSAR